MGVESARFLKREMGTGDSGVDMPGLRHSTASFNDKDSGKDHSQSRRYRIYNANIYHR